MAAITLLVRKTRAKIGSIELDASISEQHNIESEVTDSPVEQGVSISDHIRRKPDTVTIEGLITNNPIPTASAARRTLDGSTPVLSEGQFNASSRSVDDPSLVITAFNDLRSQENSGRLITIVTALREYKNMVMTSCSIPRDAKSGQAIRFTATFRQVRIVNNQTIQIARTEAKLKPVVKGGEHPTTAAPVANSSALNKIVTAGREKIADIKKSLWGAK